MQKNIYIYLALVSLLLEYRSSFKVTDDVTNIHESCELLKPSAYIVQPLLFEITSVKKCRSRQHAVNSCETIKIIKDSNNTSRRDM